MNAPRLLLRDACGFAGVFREVFLEEWQRPGDVATIDKRFDHQKAFIRSLAPGSQIVTVSFVREGAIGPLDSGTRDALKQRLAENSEHVKAAAVVLAATGFKAAVFRSIFAALTLFTNAKHPTKTETSLEPALDWAATFMTDDAAGKLSGGELLVAYRSLVEMWEHPAAVSELASAR